LLLPILPREPEPSAGIVTVRMPRCASASPARVRCRPLALEPRLLFDGAAGATGEAAAAAPAENAGVHPVTGAGAAEGVGPEAAAQAPEALFDRLAGALSDPLPPVSISLHKGAFADLASLEAAVLEGPQAVGAADAGGMDGADVVHFAVSVTNQGSDAAFDLQVRDQLPSGLDVAAVGEMRLIGADGRTIDYSTGQVLRNAATGESICSETSFAEALFSDCGVEFVDPASDVGFLGGSCDAGQPDTFTIAYQVALPGTVVAGEALCSQANVVQAAPGECGPNLIDACDPPADGATVTIESARIETRLVGTSQSHTAGADAVIGEILTFETVLTLPEGRSPDAVLTQWLDAGLSLVAIDSIAYGEGVTAEAAPDPAAIIPEAFDGGEANRFSMRFGEIANHNGDDGRGGTITVTYRAVAANVAANQAGRELVATAGYRSAGEGDGRGDGCGSSDAAVELAAMSEPVTVVEPVLNVRLTTGGEPVERGGRVEFVVTVSNDSQVDAFDVTVDHLVLPAGLELAPDSPAPPDDAGVLALVLPAGQQISYRLVTQVAAEAPAGQELAVNVVVRYTSLPGDEAACGATGQGSRDLSPFVTGSDRERTGDDGPRGLDDYLASDQARVVAVAPPPCAPVDPPPACGPQETPPPAAPPPGPTPRLPPPGPPPSPPPSPPAALPDRPVGVPPDSPEPSPPDGRTQARPGLLPEDRASAPLPAPALADLLPQGWPVPPPPASDPFARPMLDGVDLPGVDARMSGELEPGPAPAAGEKPVAPDDDCVPATPPVAKPQVLKSSVFAEGPAKPRNRSFSEQVDAALKRVAPPAVVKPPPAPDC
jgi:uncharacterized repeat protein (TIGR01451 family)